MQGIENLDHDQLVHVLSAVLGYKDDLVRHKVTEELCSITAKGGNCSWCREIMSVLTAPRKCECCGQEVHDG